MDDEKKTQNQLVKELAQLRRKVALFEATKTTIEEPVSHKRVGTAQLREVEQVLTTEIIKRKQADQAAYEGVGEVAHFA